MPHSILRCGALLGLMLFGCASSVRAQALTLDFGSAANSVTNTLVAHGDVWHWRRGTNAPQSDWQTAADAALDSTWASAPGGFGYGDDAIGGEATRLNPGMQNVHTTVYIRRSFTTTGALDTNAVLILRADYDDGFVAYLDGVEIARRNVPGAAGTAVLSTATTGGVSHEASCCNTPNPAVFLNLGAVAGRLAAGDHVFGIIGVNQDIASSDFHLIADLYAVTTAAGTNAGAVNLGLFALATTNVVQLTGSNTVVGATRVTVNGNEATTLANSTWSLSRTLSPGMNRLYIAALDNSGNILADLNQDIVYEASTISVGGTVSGNISWTDPAVTVHVTNTLFVTQGTLAVGPGVVVMLAPGASIWATNNGAVEVAGSDDKPAFFLPANGSEFGSLAASDTNAPLTIRHAEIVGGQVRSQNGGSVVMEDSVARELPYGVRELVAAVNGGGVAIRRSRLARFTEVDAKETPFLVEDSLIEGFFIDGLDIKGTNVPLVVRATTLRYASPTNSNADALDFGPGPGTVERCLIHDFPDKGVSIGGASGTSIRDTLIYRCGIGISAYASSNVLLVNNTVAECLTGILFRDNPQPAFGAATNLIVWANTNNVVITNTSALSIEFSDIAGTNFPGAGNISSDPLFADPSRHDYTLGAGSPALAAGAGGANMGATFPVGGIPSQPLRLASFATTNSVLLAWVDDAENESGVLVQRSTNSVDWETIGAAAANATSYADVNPVLDQPYYYRVRATNGAGVSAFSNPTRAFVQGPITFAGGTLTGNTTWSGIVNVTNNVTVPAPYTLTISAGTVVRLTNSAGVTASGGGHLVVNGTRGQLVTFDRMNSSFTRWGDLLATGAGSTVDIRFAKITHGRVRATSSGAALVEDSELSQMASTGIIGGSGGSLFTVRRSYVHDYEDIDLVNTRSLAEDSLFERANSDIFELQSSPAGSILRRCTFRNCLNPNSDGVDMNGCVGVLIDSCLIYNVTDKGISSGSATSASDPTSVGLVVSNSLIHSANIGIGIKDSGTASLFHNTISATSDGVAVYAKFTPQGGFITNGANNLVWGVTNAVRATNGGAVSIVFSDLEGTNWPGAGNFSADPLFWNAAQFDYRLGANSIATGGAQDGGAVGARFPVGAPMAPSHPRIDSLTLSNGTAVVRFWADSEKSYTLSTSDAVAGATWTTITNIPSRATPVPAEVAIPAGSGDRYLRLRAQ